VLPEKTYLVYVYCKGGCSVVVIVVVGEEGRHGYIVMVLALRRAEGAGYLYASAARLRCVREQLGQVQVVALQLAMLGGLELVVEEQVQGMGSCYRRSWLAIMPWWA
jgi:hypothetical protein